MFLKNVPFDTSLHTYFQRHAQDEVANTLMANFVASNQVALRSTADGDCFFNSVSTLLCGSESRTTELSYRCCIYMVLEKSNIMINRHYKKVTVIFPQINTDCLNCTRPGTYSSMHMFIAMSLLLNIPIKVYPAVNGSKNYNFKVMNLSEESKEKREHKFFNDKGKSSQNIAISTDGQRTVYTTPNAGKKLNQATGRERRDPDLEHR